MEPSVRSGSMQGFAGLMRSLGHDPNILLAEVGLATEDLADDERRVPLRRAFELLARSAEVTGLPDLGLRAAAVQDISMLGPLAFALQNCPTAGHALAHLKRYLYVQSPALSLTAHDAHEGARRTIELRYDPGEAHLSPISPVVYDHGIAIAHLVLRSIVGAGYALLAVSLPFVPRPSNEAHERFFGVPIRTGTTRCALHFDAAMRDAPIASAKPALLKLASDYLAAHFPVPESPLVPRVRLALIRSLANAFVEKADVAALFGMHPRTLQRQLAREGTTYEQLRDEVRAAAALRYLRETRLPLAEIAELVGFTEQSTFTRFCRRMHGKPPSALREPQP